MRRRRFWLPVCLLLLVVAGPVRGDLVPVPTSTIRHDQPDSSYTGLAADYPSVGAVVIAGATLSGTLIGSDWVLTAAHVLQGASAGDVQFVVGGNTYTGAEIVIEPTWTGNLFEGNDVALLRLSTAVTNVIPAAYNAFQNEIGQIGTFIGFGATGNGLTGFTGPGGTARAGQNMIDVTADSTNDPDAPPNETFTDRTVLMDFDNPLNPSDSWLGDTTPLELEFNVAGGDSGGGLFVDFGSGPVLVGVGSFLLAPDGTNNSDYGDGSGMTRTSSHADFIFATTGIAPFNPIAVPEPSTTLLLALLGGTWGGARLNLLRRRRVQRPTASHRLAPRRLG